jgi:spermidine synthase
VIGGTWYCDGWDPHLKILHRVRATLFAADSPYQRVEVCQTHGLGRVLILDGFPQAAEADEMVYATALAWPALLGTPGPGRVLITGGGDGHVLREVLRFPAVTRAVVCDIDPLVTRATREHMPFLWAGAHADPRAEVRHEDAWAYLSAAPTGSFDVVISDITDPTGEGTVSQHLYSAEYFARIRAVLAPGGICVAQAQEISVRESSYHRRLAALVAGIFPHVRSGQVFVPSFGYPQGFLFAAADPARLALEPPEVTRRLRAAGLGSDPYFDAAVYQAMFTLPPLLRAVPAPE